MIQLDERQGRLRVRWSGNDHDPEPTVPYIKVAMDEEASTHKGCNEDLFIGTRAPISQSARMEKSYFMQRNSIALFFSDASIAARQLEGSRGASTHGWPLE
jgi:hypothetical protein